MNNKILSQSIKSILLILCSIVTSSGSDTLTLDAYLEIIGENYPLIQKAELFDAFAEAYIQLGRGALDPKVNSGYKKKRFEDKNYYSVWQSELKIPTIFPIDFSVGYERNDGQFLNSENSVPQLGLFYGTFNVSLLRGLMFDDQRYKVQSAELKGIKSQIDKDILVREIIFQAIITYLDWAAAYNKNEIIQAYLNSLQDRHLNIIQLFENGDKPAIDTVESKVYLNTATKDFLLAKNELNIKTQKLSLFLWSDENTPLEINDTTVIPESISSLMDQMEDFASIDNLSLLNDPSIRKFENEVDQLRLKNKLVKENLKPRLDLKYNTIVRAGDQTFGPTLDLNDYKYGLNVEVPIRNRKTKSSLRLNEILIEQTTLEQRQYYQQLLNKFEMLLISKSVQEDIVDVTNEKIDNSQTLFQAEDLKFNLGESSVFLLNQREQKLLQARYELVKSLKSLGITLAELYYLKLGQLN